MEKCVERSSSEKPGVGTKPALMICEAGRIQIHHITQWSNKKNISTWSKKVSDVTLRALSEYGGVSAANRRVSAANHN
jgi:hypothetical protein